MGKIGRIDKRKATISFESHWRNGNKFVTVRSTRIVWDNGAIDPKSTITFSGKNPFPCYRMISTYYAVSEWLIANGWERFGSTTQFATYNLFDTATGELVGQVQDRTYYVPTERK